MKNDNLEDLLIEESKVIFKYLIKIGASKENAEDIIQETLYKTLKNIDSINENKISIKPMDYKKRIDRITTSLSKFHFILRIKMI